MWVEKYKPKNLKEFLNQKEAVETFLFWIKSWKPGKKPLLFYGPPGTGKTCLIESYAREKNLDFIEMNASDYRSAGQIREVIGYSVKQKSLFKRGKIFMIDEIDGVAGVADKGGVGEIIKIIKESSFPIVLTSNNPYDQKLRTLRAYCQLVSFKRFSASDIEKRLAQICESEKITYDKDFLKVLAKRSNGDLRSAINDLESLARGKKKISVEDLESLGYREREANIFDALKIIFKTKSLLTAKLSISDIDKEPEEIFWWIENNVAVEYEDPKEIAAAYDILSKADLFRSRISARQNWKMRAYMIDLMTGGVAVSKKEIYRKFTKYQYPSNIALLGQTLFERKDEKEILSELSKTLHCSIRKLRKEYLPYIKIFNKNSCELRPTTVESRG